MSEYKKMMEDKKLKLPDIVKAAKEFDFNVFPYQVVDSSGNVNFSAYQVATVLEVLMENEEKPC